MGYTKMKFTDGTYATVNDDYIEKYKAQGYTTDLDAPLDYDKLPANSIYRDENKGLAGRVSKPQTIVRNTSKSVSNGSTNNVDTAANSNRYMQLREAIVGGNGTSDMINEMERLNRANNNGNVTAGKDLEYLRGLIGNQPTTTTTSNTSKTVKNSSGNTNVSNNTNMINDAYKQQLKSIVTQIKSAIAKSKQGYNNIIQDAPRQFQDAKNQTEVGRMRGLESLREVIANRGDSGGIGRSEMLTADLGYQNQLNNINLDQAQVITDAQRAIANLEEQGRFAEAEAVADNAYQQLQAVMQENARIDNMKLNIGQMLGTYGGQRTLSGQQFDYGMERDSIEDARYNEEIQRKLTEAKAKADIENQNELFDRTYQLWLQGAPLTPAQYQILGIPNGTISDNAKKADYSIDKPYFAPKSSSGSGGTPWYLK